MDKYPETENRSFSEHLSPQEQQAISKAALCGAELMVIDQPQPPEYFNLEDMSVRIASELVLGTEAQKIKKILNKGWDKLLTNQQIDDLVSKSQLVDQIKSTEDADFAIDEVKISTAGDDDYLYIIDEFYDFRKQLAEQIAQFKKSFANNQADYEQALKQLSYKTNHEKRTQLSHCLTTKLIEFNRQVQELLSRPHELATLHEIQQFIEESAALTHFPTDRDKDGQLTFINAANSKFNRLMIEQSLIGAINERCFKQLFELTDLGQSIEYHTSTIKEDLRGIDCHLLVNYYTDETGQYHLADPDQITKQQCQQFLLPVDVKASDRLANQKLTDSLKRAKRRNELLTSWPMFSGIHQEDLSLYRDSSGAIEMSPIHQMRTGLDKDTITMMEKLPKHISYGKRNGYRPANLEQRLDLIKANILRGVRYYTAADHPTN